MEMPAQALGQASLLRLFASAVMSAMKQAGLERYWVAAPASPCDCRCSLPACCVAGAICALELSRSPSVLWLPAESQVAFQVELMTAASLATAGLAAVQISFPPVSLFAAAAVLGSAQAG
jgi:hypothetical protein